MKKKIQQLSATQFNKKLIRLIQMLLVFLSVLVVLGIGMRGIHYFLLRSATEKHATLTVATMKAERGPRQVEIILPGNIHAWHDTTIYARTSGYVVRWLVDVGSEVKEGDLLAEITTPEVNAQLRQAEADLQIAEANYHLAQTTAKRWQILWKTESVSKQETDEKVSQEQAMAAVVQAARANCERLRELVSFERVIAPFDGVIRSRTTDIGRLINKGSAKVPLFHLVQTNPLRVYVRVPEYFAANVIPGIQAELTFPQLPGKVYPAKLLDTAKAIEPQSMTLLVQLEVDNTRHELFSGSSSEVHLHLPTINSVILPVNTLMFRAEGLQVAVIEKNQQVVFKSITMGSDFGDTVEVVSGVNPNDMVVLNPPDSLLNHQRVQVVKSS